MKHETVDHDKIHNDVNKGETDNSLESQPRTQGNWRGWHHRKKLVEERKTVAHYKVRILAGKHIPSETYKVSNETSSTRLEQPE